MVEGRRGWMGGMRTVQPGGRGERRGGVARGDLRRASWWGWGGGERPRSASQSAGLLENDKGGGHEEDGEGQASGGKKYEVGTLSFYSGLSLSLNFIMGSGFLAIPWAMNEAGIATVRASGPGGAGIAPPRFSPRALVIVARRGRGWVRKGEWL